MPIKNLTEIRRLPRLGKIHLGIKKFSEKAQKEYPAEVHYFVCPPEVAEVYGEQPTKLDIMFPVDNPEIVFPQFYKMYGSSTLLKCKGDGEKASRITDKGGFEEIECPGEECPYRKNRKCNRIGVLNVLLPKVPGAGVWQITTSSWNSIVNLNSAMDYIRGLCGRVNMIPLILERKEELIQYEGKKSKHYILSINMDFKLEDVQRAALISPTRIALPAPDDTKDDLFYSNGEGTEAKAEPKPEAKKEEKPEEQERKKLLARVHILKGKKLPGDAGNEFYRDMLGIMKAYNEDGEPTAAALDVKGLNKLIEWLDKQNIQQEEGATEPEAEQRSDPMDPTDAEREKVLSNVASAMKVKIGFGGHAGKTLGDLYKEKSRYLKTLASDKFQPADDNHRIAVQEAAKRIAWALSEGLIPEEAE